MANAGGRQRVFFKCKYCKVLFDDATSLVAHKRFEHADQLFGKSPNGNNKSDWDGIRPPNEKSPAKIQTRSPSGFSAKIEPDQQSPGPSSKIYKIPGTSSNQKSEKNTRLKCRFCPKALPSTDKLHEHERIHTGEKPYQCQHCLKGFPEESEAERHETNCPVLEILKSQVKKEETKPRTGPQVPSKNRVKPLKCANFISVVNSKPKNSDYLRKRISFTRNVRCKICHRNIKHASNLARHMKIHERSKNPMRRNNPDDNFPIMQTEKVPFLPQLLKCIGSEGRVNFSCRRCNKRLNSRHGSWYHLQRHFGRNIFTCPVCNERFSAAKEIVAHFSRHPTNVTSALEDATEISAYITRFCWATRVQSAQQEETDKHFTEQEDLEGGCRWFKCKFCHFKVLSPGGVSRVGEFRRRMRLHVRRKHTESDLYKCQICHRGYSGKRQLQKHSCRLKISHPRNVPCPICHRNIKYAHNLTRHMKIHNRPHAMAAKRYQDTLGPATVKVEGLRCLVCAIGFDSNESLAIHNDGHSKMPFLCTKCGLWFRRAQGIKKHLATCAK